MLLERSLEFQAKLYQPALEHASSQSRGTGARSYVACSTGAQLMDLLLLQILQMCCLEDQGSPSVHVVSVESSCLLLHSIKT